MPSALFVCTGNMYRSPIAAETFRTQTLLDGQAEQWKVSSAGTWTVEGRRAPDNAIELARSYGLNIDEHITRMVNREMLEEADLILVMEEGHKESIQAEFPFVRKKIYLLAQIMEGFAYNIPDPASAPSEAKEIIRDLVTMICAGYRNIYQIAQSI